MGTRLADMARMRLEYDEARKRIQTIQKQLSDLEEKVSPGQAESDQDRLLLFQEKEQLLRELRSITPRTHALTPVQMSEIQQEINRVKQDLNNALEMSNRAIADRVRLHEEKQLLLQQLRDVLRSMTCLESQLKTLSASTLSMSSSSSLGSLSTTSSKGSLSSGLSFTDIYGGPQCSGSGFAAERPVDMVDLHRRVERLLRDSPTVSPRSSLLSVSPPVSVSPLYSPATGPPPAYEHVEWQRKQEDRLFESRLTQAGVGDYVNCVVNCCGVGAAPSPSCAAPCAAPAAPPAPPPRPPSAIPLADFVSRSGNMSQGSGLGRPASCGSLAPLDPPLSPISETPTSSGTNTRSVSAAVSDESVAGDSGVFEASHKKQQNVGGMADMNMETAQVQIKLRYVLLCTAMHMPTVRALARSLMIWRK